ncbi:selenium-dependent molybdenum cofactor biosynthesis protein YqeB [Thermophilibacter immobilis]|uniref:EF2563 family selenium-dependent molybdenum hydroxylase system protein n=1 Tax=Thermophilibacter immobilis TaxID=2779519 RepID=A0A7S7M7N3_9ACTN|nr:selenium-dependent molybdenum cofactor biosynthesis protein YqeB [Thermophilibacter immobilis]QOY60209.1 EF2563 family selenium-dependent molybdenum hydroxylase system protein [Thermophilibacter immobilis]
MLVEIRGAGDIATGVALRLHRAGCDIVMCDLAVPTSIRRTVSFSEAIRLGSCEVEDVRAVRAKDVEDARKIVVSEEVAVLVDPGGSSAAELVPDALVDAILAKKNLGTTPDMAPVVIGVGPGFTAGRDCHAVVETKRGHYLGQAIYEGSAAPNTGIPGVIAGHSADRVLRAPADGIFEPRLAIGDVVRAGQVAAVVSGVPMTCTINGVLRGLLQEGVEVTCGMKSGDIDPRCERAHCFTSSDKARAVGGGVLEALCHLTGGLRA